MKRAFTLFAAALLAILLLVAAYFVGRNHSAPSAHGTAASSSKGGRKILYWYDTMVPQQHFDQPGLSPMGMQMVPRYANEKPADEKPADEQTSKGEIRIDPATVQNLGVRTVRVERRVLASAIEVPGTVSWDLRQASTVSARVDAVVVKLDVRAPYAKVAAGAPLVELLAPQWSSALAEYRALQQAQSADARQLRAAARERLRVLGLTSEDIRSARPGTAAIGLHAPQAGVVTALDVREGQRVTAGQTLMTINGLSTVWVEAALPQTAAAAVRSGTPVSVTAEALAGRTFHGSVETLLPDIDPATRTQRARIVLDNADGALNPGMFVDVQLNPVAGDAVPVVPDDALIATGSSQTRVIVAEQGGHFRAVPVRVGRSAGGYTEIRGGLSGGEKVVVSGQFLIDSEASLSGALERLDDAKSAPSPQPSPPAAPGEREQEPATAASTRDMLMEHKP